MAELRKKRRDTTANLALVTPVEGVLGVDTTRRGIIIGDGTAVGGIPSPTFNELINGDWIFGNATSDESPDSGDAITLTIDSRYQYFTDGGSIKAGAKFRFLAPAANTGAVSLTVDWSAGSDVATLKKYALGVQADLDANDFVAGQLVEVIFDGTVFQVVGGVAASPQFELIETFTDSSVSQVDITSFDNTVYTTYLLALDHFDPVTDGANFRLRTSSDGGSTFDQASDDYQWHGHGVKIGTEAVDYNETGAEGVYIEPHDYGIGNLDSEQMFGMFWFLAMGDTARQTKIQYFLSGRNGVNEHFYVTGVGSRNAAEANDAIRIYASTGNINSWNAKLYGLK